MKIKKNPYNFNKHVIKDEYSDFKTQVKFSWTGSLSKTLRWCLLLLFFSRRWFLIFWITQPTPQCSEWICCSWGLFYGVHAEYAGLWKSYFEIIFIVRATNITIIFFSSVFGNHLYLIRLTIMKNSPKTRSQINSYNLRIWWTFLQLIHVVLFEAFVIIFIEILTSNLL